LEGDLAHIGADGRLLIAGPVLERSERTLKLEPAERGDQLLGICRIRLGNAGSERFHRVIADDGAEPRIVAPTLLIGGEEGLVGWRIDRVPRIAGYDPADRGLVLERIEIFRFARKQAHHGAVLERAAGG